MSGHLLCCRYEPSLEDLLAEDEVMMPVLRSAGLDRSELRALLAETARRLEYRAQGGEGGTGFGPR
jgi:2-hydroxychromene-2-carboxylate isomerase